MKPTAVTFYLPEWLATWISAHGCDAAGAIATYYRLMPPEVTAKKIAEGLKVSPANLNIAKSAGTITNDRRAVQKLPVSRGRRGMDSYEGVLLDLIETHPNTPEPEIKLKFVEYAKNYRKLDTTSARAEYSRTRARLFRKGYL